MPDGLCHRCPRSGCGGGARCRSWGHLQDEQDDSGRHVRAVRAEGERAGTEARRGGSGSLPLRCEVRQRMGEDRGQGRKSLPDVGRRLRDRRAGAERRERDRRRPDAADHTHPMRWRLSRLRRTVRRRSHLLGLGERRPHAVVRMSAIGRDAVREHGRLRGRRTDVWRRLSRWWRLLHAQDRRQHAECDLRLRPSRLDPVYQQFPADVWRYVSARTRLRRRSARPVLVRLPVSARARGAHPRSPSGPAILAVVGVPRRPRRLLERRVW